MLNFASKYVYTPNESVPDENIIIHEDELDDGLINALNKTDTLLDQANREQLLNNNLSSRSVVIERRLRKNVVNPPSACMPLQRKQFNLNTNINIVSVKFGPLSSNADEIHAGDPVYCNGCKAVLNSCSKLVDKNVWNCEFCLYQNNVNIETEEFPKSDITDFITEPAPQVQLIDDSYVVFCIDTSGSMCVTTEVQGHIELKGNKNFDFDLASLGPEFYDPNQQLPQSNSTWVSRMQSVQLSVEKQLEDMAKLYPNKKVCLIAFNGQVTIIGDGISNIETVCGDKLSNQNLLEQIGKKYEFVSTIKDSKIKLIDELYKLKEDGPTALGPALLIASSIASKKAGSSVIVCTDGLANIGLGSFFNNPKASEWYESVGEAAKLAGVSISVISLKGDDCSLAELGRVAELTGGFVDRVDPLELNNNFASILSKNKVLATNVTATLILNKSMQFVDDEIAKDSFFMTKDVGNATEDTEFTFQFSVRDKEMMAIYANDDSIPFQLKISFTKLDGMKCLRTISKSQKVTSEKELAEKDLNLYVIGANAAKQAVLLAKKGHYAEARANTYAWGKKLQSSAVHATESSKDRTTTQYCNYMQRMDELDTVLQEQTMDQEEEEEVSVGHSLFDFFGGLSSTTSKPSQSGSLYAPFKKLSASALNPSSAAAPKQKMKDSHYSVIQNMKSASKWSD